MNFILAAASMGDMVKETGETFGFDVKIFLSQVISFIIVALVLKRFAYKPILAVLEERRQRIAEGLLNAEKIKQQLAEAEQRHAEILAKANAQAQKMIDDARSRKRWPRRSKSWRKRAKRARSSMSGRCWN
jgi:F-type H+-transporting ATPase subunit b